MNTDREYVISFRFGEHGNIITKIVDGNEFARLYGFSDVSDAEILYAYRVQKAGWLMPVKFCGNWKAPYNWLIIENEYGEELERYEWKAH